MIEMKKYSRMIVIIFCIMLITVFYWIYVNVELKPFGYAAPMIVSNDIPLNDYDVNADIMNTSIYSYRLDRAIYSIDDFIDYLKENHVEFDEWGMHSSRSISYELGSFMDKNYEVDWDKVRNSVETERLWWRTVYSIDYKTLDPGCNGYKLSIASHGYVWDYRSAGK